MILCQFLHVVATRLRGSQWSRGLWWGKPVCQSRSIENPASATDSPIRAQLCTTQTPTDPLPYHTHPGIWPRRTMADGFGGHAKNGIRATNICWPWSMPCPNMPGRFLSNPKALKKWYQGSKGFADKPRHGSHSACRRIKANNFSIQGSHRGSRNTADIIFRHMGIVRPPWWNDGIAPWNNGCTATLQPTIRHGTWTCCNRWSTRTINPIIGVLTWDQDQF